MIIILQREQAAAEAAIYPQIKQYLTECGIKCALYIPASACPDCSGVVPDVGGHVDFCPGEAMAAEILSLPDERPADALYSKLRVDA